MAVALTNINKLSFGNARGTIATVTFAAGDYTGSPTGVTLDPATFRVGRIIGVAVLGGTDPEAVFYWDPTNSKLRAMVTGPGLGGVMEEATAAEAAAAGAVQVLVIGDIVNKG